MWTAGKRAHDQSLSYVEFPSRLFQFWENKYEIVISEKNVFTFDASPLSIYYKENGPKGPKCNTV
jgi:hypothetical protein